MKTMKRSSLIFANNSAKAKEKPLNLRALRELRANKKASLVIGTTGVVLTSGLAYWNSYSTDSAPKLQKIEDVDQWQPQFLTLDNPFKAPSPKADEIKSMIPKHLRKPWKLLHKANTGDQEQHLNAVRELSLATSGLCDGELRQLGQSMQGHTAIGLARIKEADLRLFLPPPPTPKVVQESSIPLLFWNILNQLPKSKDVHECIKYFTSTALEQYIRQAEDDFIRDDDLNHEFQRDTHLIMDLPPRNRHSSELVIEYCLVAILSHSTIKSHCQTLISSTQLLPMVIRIIEEYPENNRLKSLIGKIIANISLFPETHSTLFCSGWVGILAEWARNSNLLISLPASKALSNLDQKYGKCTYAPGIYLVSPNDRVVQHQNELSNRGVDIVLLHGLLGGVFFTWRQHDKVKERSWTDPNLISSKDYTYCWPRDWLIEDGLDDGRVRIIGVDFDAYVSQWGNSCPNESFKTSLADRSKDILDKLRQCGVGKRPVIFVGHSMGGLVAKKMLVQAQAEQDHDLVKNTKGVMFFSTPHMGTKVAKMNSTTKFLFFPTTEVCDLEPDSPQLLDLNQNFVHLVEGHNDMKIVSFGEAFTTPMMGIDVTFVPPSSADIGLGEFHQIKANHINVCKPDSKESLIYKKFFHLVSDVLEDNGVPTSYSH